jgi:exopolysaccharide production protein ExoQ
MSPQIALLLCFGFVCVAIIADVRRTSINSKVSNAIWVPLIWLTILASRPIPNWLHPTRVLNTDVESGNAIDRMVLTALIVAAIAILAKRKLRWEKWIRDNRWLIVFYVYCGISSTWADFPEVALKRWIRAIGAVIMILVILTERDPVASVATAIRRCGYVLLPLSLLFIKYYRDLGVAYNEWTGELLTFGATTDKNALGRVCMIFGLFAFWEFLAASRAKRGGLGTLNKVVRSLMFVIAVWLLLMSRSATSLVCFLIGCMTLLVLGLGPIRRNTKYLGTFVIAGIAMVVLFSAFFDLETLFLSSLGKNPTLTNRTFIWHDLLARVENPLVGVGYDSFWIGERLEYFVRVHKVTSAHNGYLDVYLELGLLGLLLFGLFLYSIFVNAKRSLITGSHYGKVVVTVLFVFLAYNVTEAGWRATHLSFFVLLLVGIQAPVRRKVKVATNARAGETSNGNAEAASEGKTQLPGGGAKMPSPNRRSS